MQSRPQGQKHLPPHSLCKDAFFFKHKRMSLLTQRWAALGRPSAGNRSGGPLGFKSMLACRPLRVPGTTRTNRSVLQTIAMADSSSNGDGSNGVRLNKQGMVVSATCDLRF